MVEGGLVWEGMRDCSLEVKLGWSLGIKLQAALPHSQALQLQRRTKMMAKCISPSAGHSSSTNVLIVGAGWCWIMQGRGSLDGGRGLGLDLGPVAQVLLA